MKGAHTRGSPHPSEASQSGTWSYDGSLEGLVVLSHRAYASRSVPDAVANALAEAGELFALLGPDPLESASSNLERDAESAGSELRSFSGELFDMIARIWMSEEPLELPLFRLCAEAGLHGAEVLANHSSPDLRALSRAARRVYHEIDRLSGLARFSPRHDGIFSAPIEPDANIIAALIPRFARRFGSEDFALVDIRRRLAFARRSGRFESAAGEEALAFLPDSGPEEDLLLWKRYFRATENPARRNPELQRRLMPMRYWRYLPEMLE
jgi:probable DNA metabolism protein